MKRLLTIFLISFLLNFVWENLHSLLYASYMGGDITQFILFHASLGDAVMITIVCLPFIYLASFRKHSWTIVPIGLIIAVSIEWAALSVGRWSYNEFMPIIPILNIGLTPTIQLALLGYLSLILSEKK